MPPGFLSTPLSLKVNISCSAARGFPSLLATLYPSCPDSNAFWFRVWFYFRP